MFWPLTSLFPEQHLLYTSTSILIELPPYMSGQTTTAAVETLTENEFQIVNLHMVAVARTF